MSEVAIVCRVIKELITGFYCAVSIDTHRHQLGCSYERCGCKLNADETTIMKRPKWG
jgi:hypothetical protein